MKQCQTYGQKAGVSLISQGDPSVMKGKLKEEKQERQRGRKRDGRVHEDPERLSSRDRSIHASRWP